MSEQDLKKKLLSVAALSLKCVVFSFPMFLDLSCFFPLRHTAVDGKRREVRSVTSERVVLRDVLNFLTSCVRKGSKWLWLGVNPRDHNRGILASRPMRERWRKKNKSLRVLCYVVMLFPI